MSDIIANINLATWLAIASEMLAMLLLVRIWRTELHLVEKIALSVLAVVPFVGPFFAWWLCHDPGPAPPSLQDKRGMSLNVYDRWRDVFDEPDPEIRKRKAAILRSTHPGD